MFIKEYDLTRFGIFIYGIVTYVVGLVGQIWFILYLTNWNVVEKTVYAPAETSALFAVVINALLVSLFAMQHSVMARKWFKQYLLKIIPQAMERSTYVLFSGLVFIIVCLYAEPIDGVLWDIQNSFLVTLLWVGFVFGWAFSVLATFVINHFELFGLQQVYLHLLQRQAKEIEFQERFFYKFIRHPIQLGVLLGLWITPTMSYGHLSLSLFFSIYIFIGLYFEERDLVEDLGDVYREYKKRVGLMFPKLPAK